MKNQRAVVTGAGYTNGGGLGLKQRGGVSASELGKS
jgi:hypothetical protein